MKKIINSELGDVLVSTECEFSSELKLLTECEYEECLKNATTAVYSLMKGMYEHIRKVSKSSLGISDNDFFPGYLKEATRIAKGINCKLNYNILFNMHHTPHYVMVYGVNSIIKHNSETIEGPARFSVKKECTDESFWKRAKELVNDKEYSAYFISRYLNCRNFFIKKNLNKSYDSRLSGLLEAA
ncbi:MAG: hypothetical protein WC755_02710 [Candidatus Woesearchaeota archaeon]|jgi:hypothetical protein